MSEILEEINIDNQVVYFNSSENMMDIKDNTIDLIITSPPYWNLKDYKHPNQIGQEDYDKYLERLNVVWDECYRVSKENGILAINVRNMRYRKTFYPIGMDIYKNMKKWKLIDNLIWYIPNALPQPNYYISRLFDDKHENIIIFAKNYNYEYTFNKIRVKQKYSKKDPRKEKLNPKGRCIGNVIRIPAYRPPNVKQMGYYVSAFPEELVYLLIMTFSNEGNVILDPFLGSGTTLKVSRITRRIGYGYEINPNLVSIISKKIKEQWKPPEYSFFDIISSSRPFPENTNVSRRPKMKKISDIQKTFFND